jgi:transcriptional regulator with XRE-family HTH domain
VPRVNARRSTASEANLARRIKMEREAREWSYEGLSKRMESAGYPIGATSIFKIEKGRPRPRRITVDEAVGFALVFGVDVKDLLRPVDTKLTGEARKAVQAWIEARYDEEQARFIRTTAEMRIGQYIARFPETKYAIRDSLAQWADAEGWDVQETVEAIMLQLGDDADQAIAAHVVKWRGGG